MNLDNDYLPPPNVPPEILLQIFNAIDQDSLFDLAKVSRQFNDCALEEFLARLDPFSRALQREGVLEIAEGIQLATELRAESRSAIPLLKVIRISISFTTLHEIRWKFSRDDIVKQIAHFKQVLDHIQAVKTLVLDFSNAWIDPAPSSLTPEAFSGFLSSVAESIKGKGCQSLTVYRANFNIHHCGSPQVTSRTSFWRELIMDVANRYLFPSSSSFTKHPASTLSAYALRNAPQTRRLVQVFSSLHSLTHLSIHTDVVHYMDWSAILSCTHIPNLTHLALDGYRLPFTSMLRFLYRHSAIQDLKLHVDRPEWEFDSGPRWPAFPQDGLPHLCRLSANEEYIAHLLTNRSQQSTKIQMLEVFLCPPPFGAYRKVDLVTIGQRLNDELVTAHFSENIDMHITIQINTILIRPDIAVLRQHLQFVDASRLFHRTKGVTFIFIHSGWPDRLQHYIPEWLSLFPVLEKVDLIHTVKEPGEEDWVIGQAIKGRLGPEIPVRLWKVRGSRKVMIKDILE